MIIPILFPYFPFKGELFFPAQPSVRQQEVHRLLEEGVCRCGCCCRPSQHRPKGIQPVIQISLSPSLSIYLSISLSLIYPLGPPKPHFQLKNLICIGNVLKMTEFVRFFIFFPIFLWGLGGGMPKRSLSSYICWQSSRVGAMISIAGPLPGNRWTPSSKLGLTKNQQIWVLNNQSELLSHPKWCHWGYLSTGTT